MVARLSQARFAPEDVPAAKEFVQAVAVPGALQHPGFTGMTMLSLEDGHVLVIELYETQEQLRDTETAGWYQQMAEAIEDKVQGQVRRTIYQVPLHVDAANPSEPNN
jgi:quinol monooxygenase YgiN